MANITTDAWVAQEKTAFKNFNEFIAERLEEAHNKMVPTFLGVAMQNNPKATLTLPIGTFSSEIKVVGETSNINVSFEPSKEFQKLIDEDTKVNLDRYNDKVDPEYVRLFVAYVAYGQLEPAKSEADVKEKGMRLRDDEPFYFLNEYMQVLATIARDKKRVGKTFRLELLSPYQFGSFDFEYTDDGTNIRFVPSKAFKQSLKDDSALDVARSIYDGSVTKIETIAKSMFIFGKAPKKSEWFKLKPTKNSKFLNFFR